MLYHVFLLIVGLFLLIKGSDLFVKSASSIAKKLGVSEFVIGLTLVAVGTSIPELVSSLAASLKQQSDIVIGNIVGSNIANIGLIIGLAAIISVIKTREEMLKRDGYIMLLAALLFYLFSIDGMISRIESMIFILFYVAYIGFLFKEKPKFKGEYGFKEFITYFLKFEYLNAVVKRVNNKKGRISTSSKMLSSNIHKDFIILIFSGFAVVIGANYLIIEAVFFADMLNISKTLVGLTLVAVGTSLPELSVSISAARNGYGDIAIANIIGSNIANIFLVLGICGFIFPLSVNHFTLYFVAPFMILMTILLLVFIKSQWELRSIEGVIFLILYGIFLAVIILFEF